MGSPAVILVVDDNDVGQLLVRTVLELEGFLVDTAASGKELLSQLKAGRPDLILMDIQMPGQYGLSLTRQLKADPATNAIPILALTAHAMANDREQALAAGCIEYISKPIDTRSLAGQIRDFLAVAVE
jgi:two-component system cell cycle response regulator/two-component system cell cycle response regulator DivK